MFFGNNPIYWESVSNVTATNSVEVGATRRSGDEEYRYVHNAGNSAIRPNYGATVSAVSGYSVTVSSTSGVDIFVGVCVHQTISTGYYGWLMTRGFCTVKMGADNSAAAGVPLGVGVDGTFAHVTQTTLPGGPIIGKAMEAMASGASGTAFLRLYS